MGPGILLFQLWPTFPSGGFRMLLRLHEKKKLVPSRQRGDGRLPAPRRDQAWARCHGCVRRLLRPEQLELPVEAYRRDFVRAMLRLQCVQRWASEGMYPAGTWILGNMVSSVRAKGTPTSLPPVALRTSGMRCPRTRSSRSSFSSASSSSTARAPTSAASTLVLPR